MSRKREDWEKEGKYQYDSNGKKIVEMVQCGHCYRVWNDALITSLTPTPSGRCPFEYKHRYAK